MVQTSVDGVVPLKMASVSASEKLWTVLTREGLHPIMSPCVEGTGTDGQGRTDGQASMYARTYLLVCRGLVGKSTVKTQPRRVAYIPDLAAPAMLSRGRGEEGMRGWVGYAARCTVLKPWSFA